MQYAAPRTPATWSLGALVLASLAACGGGNVSAPADPSMVSLSVQDETSASAAAIEAQPSFHAAPALLDEPDASSDTPHRQWLSTTQAATPTRGLSADALRDASARARASGAGSIRPAASTTTVVTYTPAQIRAAYGLPAIAGATPAQLGAGQTIYIVDAKHDPNAAAELAAFNTKFGLPGCSSRTLAAGAALPLAAASGSTCELVIAYSSSAGALTGTAPAYDSGWATEIALDLQWAHAIAPLARLVLIEAPDASVTSLGNAVRLATSMGTGVVSMSFGAPEGSWVSSYDSVFSGATMSYLAATGDNGAAVSWPAVSTKVLAVGGTNLSWSGSGSRSETAWASTGGGVSAYLSTPSYQSTAVSGLTRRTVADVAFNANPYTGQYVATMAPGSSTVGWISAGGTSLSTPQWAALLAVANALRLQAGKTVLGQPHTALYGSVAKTSGPFADISSGSNGSCTLCTARAGFDVPTGWGTPNGSAMLTALSGVTVATSATTTTSPTLSIAATSISGSAGTALSAQIAYDLAGASSAQISISGAPGGMAFSATASAISVAWSQPIAGSYTLRITITDNLNRTATAAVPVTIK